MKINAAWHRAHIMPKKPTEKERVQWHVDHARECACRPIPENIQALLKERKSK